MKKPPGPRAEGKAHRRRSNSRLRDAVELPAWGEGKPAEQGGQLDAESKEVPTETPFPRPAPP